LPVDDQKWYSRTQDTDGFVNDQLRREIDCAYGAFTKGDNTTGRNIDERLPE
jgi:hypothetical protein